ncbi:MAG: hypothetical protein NZ602_12240 [Thermoguttaceae bacterium]|nr:hypothetical protein [Thermoguttaceae bacterium]MDW8037474.1 hypothetical protein [Thermoguttaceae bacterium]
MAPEPAPVSTPPGLGLLASPVEPDKPGGGIAETAAFPIPSGSGGRTGGTVPTPPAPPALLAIISPGSGPGSVGPVLGTQNRPPHRGQLA